MIITMMKELRRRRDTEYKITKVFNKELENINNNAVGAVNGIANAYKSNIFGRAIVKKDDFEKEIKEMDNHFIKLEKEDSEYSEEFLLSNKIMNYFYTQC